MKVRLLYPFKDYAQTASADGATTSLPVCMPKGTVCEIVTCSGEFNSPAVHFVLTAMAYEIQQRNAYLPEAPILVTFLQQIDQVEAVDG